MRGASLNLKLLQVMDGLHDGRGREMMLGIVAQLLFAPAFHFLQRALHPLSAHKSAVPNVTAAKKVDDLTVDILTSEPTPVLPRALFNLRIMSRAIFVVGPDNKLKYVEYVPEVSHHPNYEAALAAAKG